MSLCVSVAICNPNELMFSNFLDSLKKYAPDMTILMVSDNGSDSSYKTIVDDKFKDTKVTIYYFKFEENIGFGEVHNKAFELASELCDYFAVVNDDVEFFENWTTPMIKLMEDDPDVAQVGMGEGVCNTIDVYAQGGYTETDEPDYCEGSCFIIRTIVARKIGLFDTETYKFAYLEDTDLSLRLKKAGFKIKSVKLKWIHYRAITSRKLVEKVDLDGYQHRNRLKFKERWTNFLVKRTFAETWVLNRVMGVGDVFLLTPILEVLREEHPDDALVVATLYPQAIDGSPLLDAIVKCGTPIPCDHFINFDFAYERDFRRHIVDAYAEVAGVKVKRRTGILYVPEVEKEFVDKAIPKDTNDFVIFELSDTWMGKQWADENYRQLAELIKKDGLKVIGIGETKQPRTTECDYNFFNLLSPYRTAALMSRARMVIGHEGMIMHLAQSIGLPAVILYGVTHPDFVTENTGLTEPVISPVACQGCRHVKDAGTMIFCPRKAICMDKITVDMVYEAYKKLLERTEPVKSEDILRTS